MIYRSGSINSSIQSYFTNTNNLSEKRIEPQNIIENQTQIDGYDGILIKDLPQQNYPQFSEMNSSNKVENSMLGKSLFSNSVQNDLFSSLNEGKNQKIINDNPNLNPENFDEINKKLDNLTHILEGLMKDKNNEEDKLIEKNTQKIKNETVFELKKNELQIERLEDFDSRLEKLKKSIEEETYNNNDLEVDFF